MNDPNIATAYSPNPTAVPGVGAFAACMAGLRAVGGELVVASTIEGSALASVHPRAIALFRDRPDGSPRNVWRAPVL